MVNAVFRIAKKHGEKSYLPRF